MTLRRRADPRVFGLAVAVGVPLLLTCSLTVWWVRSERLRLFGDEPHYVIIAESLTRDGDVEIRNNHALEERFPRHVGGVAPHAYEVGHRWYPLHGPGLGALIATGLSAAGVTGARLTTCAFAALLPASLFLWLHHLIGRRDALWLTLAATLSVPYVFGAVHLYPDPVAAAIIAPLLLLLGAPGHGRHRARRWSLFWLSAGLLPLLMVKFLAPALLLALFALGRATMRGADPVERRTIVTTAPWLLLGLLALAAYHAATFGNILGPRRMDELSAGAAQAWMVVLGLHLDQAQGVFLQQPLFLLGVPALGMMALRRPWLAAAWLVLYASLIGPNVLQGIAYGGASPSGRFAWPAAWLWLVPLGVTLSWHRDRLARLIRPVLLAVVAYEAALAVRWVPGPMVVTNEFTPDLTLRNSLFPVGMRAWLPSFYSPDFLSFPPNVVAIAIWLVLLASGPLLGLWLDRRAS
jgi:hypothetical protein